MTLSKYSMLLGAAIAAFQLWALIKPAEFAASVRKFHRSEFWGYLLMGIGSVWFLFNLNKEAIAEFAAYKTYMLGGFGAIALAGCFFVPDYLAVRGLCVFLLMLAWYTLSLTRWAATEWRLVLVIWAYVVVVMSMWFVVAPWRLRDLFAWAVATPERMKRLAIARLAFAVGLIVLGATVFKS